MLRNTQWVNYSYEYGDKSLPHIADLVSNTPDEKKSLILGYLKTNCVLARAGGERDLIHPEQIIGYGNIYTDGTYSWTDVFTNYVAKYNIPVPPDFRKHIIRNYSSRMKLHAEIKLVDRILILNNPYLGYTYKCEVNKNGIVRYTSNLDLKDDVFQMIKSDDASYIIDPITSQLYCYDTDNHGIACIDGYHWEITFFRKNEQLKLIEGWPNEDPWRHEQFRDIIACIGHYVPDDLGLWYMDEFWTDSFA